MKLEALVYRQFDADHGRGFPAEEFGGWARLEVDLARDRTALVVMHAWDAGEPNEFPGWERAVEYLPRARTILRKVFPRLLAAVRASGMPVFHVGEKGCLHSHGEPSADADGLIAECPVTGRVAEPDESWRRLTALRSESSFPGARNRVDVEAARERREFAPEAHPAEREPVVVDGQQLAAACRDRGINHLVYTGFAINWCLLMSPGGMVDMAARGAICSTIREAVTAVENAETARGELEKAQALWRVSLAFGFVFELDAFLAALTSSASNTMNFEGND